MLGDQGVDPLASRGGELPDRYALTEVARTLAACSTIGCPPAWYRSLPTRAQQRVDAFVDLHERRQAERFKHAVMAGIAAAFNGK